MIEFTVLGKPEPAGSKRAFMPKGARHPVITDDNPKGKDWKNAIRCTAREIYRGPLFDEALCVTFRFFRVRPRGHYRTGKNADKLRSSAPVYPTTKPDVL